MTYWVYDEETYKDKAKNGTIDNKEMIPFLAHFLKYHEIDTILDLGCGAGALNTILKKLPYKLEYIGIDLSQKAIDNAKEMFLRTPFHCFDIITKRLERKYDIIFSSEMLSHIHMVYHYSIIKDMLQNTNQYCLFSLKFSEHIGFKHFDKTWYYYPKYEYTINKIKELLNSDALIIHKKYYTRKSLIGTPHEGNIGNVIIEVIKK